jgi:trehalose 6-phosphate synthase
LSERATRSLHAGCSPATCASSRIVSVSNRLALPKGTHPTGGLAVGVLAAMREGGGLWFGWSGETHPSDTPQSAPTLSIRGGIEFATLPLPELLQDRFYNGFANGTLWPLFHYFLDGFHYRDEEYEAYEAVNALFGAQLRALLRDDDVVWVHDYHLIPLATQLRERGVTSPIGFFLHIPFPHFEVLRALPCHAALLRQLLAYDLLGFQTETDRAAFESAVVGAFGGEAVVGTGNIRLGKRWIRTGVFPIGVDVAAVARAASRAEQSAAVQHLKDGLLGRRLIIGVDRLDYSKGLLERFEAYREFLEHSPQHRGRVTYLQIAPLGRQSVKAYARIREDLEQSSGRTNGRYADVDWTPIRYLNRNFPHGTLMGFLRAAQVCLVTPVRDGMNLIAKEFVAAQDPNDPGVLILSDRAGAACELTDALLVNPYDTRRIAAALQEALEMPLAERRARHQRLLARLNARDVHAWHRSFLQELKSAWSSASTPSGSIDIEVRERA